MRSPCTSTPLVERKSVITKPVDGVVAADIVVIENDVVVIEANDPGGRTIQPILASDLVAGDGDSRGIQQSAAA
jgi:hypothetical protein